MFVTNWISPTKIQKISEITNFFRHYFLSRTEVYFSNKEMLTTTEVAEYLGVSQSQIYKLTMNMEIPHYKPQGKTIYFDKKELLKWMRNNHITPARKDSANK